MSEAPKRVPSLLISLVPLLVLVLFLVLSTKLYEDAASSGPNQIGMILAAMVGVGLSLRLGYTWKDMETAMVHGISLSMGAVFILLIVGALIGSWILCGTVPTMIYYGLQLMNPAYFYVAACLICCVVSLASGSSWTTASTIGVALIGVAAVMDLNVPMAAGAIISGAYFGDKLSPLSDTTNLAPAMAGTDLFTHIRHMLYTTIPSLVIACGLFFVLGLTGHKEGNAQDIQIILEAVRGHFDVSWYILIPPAIVIAMVVKKVPAFPALLVGALIGCVFAVVFQYDALVAFVAPAEGTPAWQVAVKGCWTALYDGFSGDLGNDKLNELLKKGGMGKMLNTIWLILSAMMFGAVMEKTGMLEAIAGRILSLASSTGALISLTLCTSIGMNVVASDQYIAIVLPGRMFRAEFTKRRLHPKNLSRCLEDAGTMTSALVPWNTCGAFMSTTLGVATLAYLPYCFLNLLNPIISAFYGYTGITIHKMTEEEYQEQMAL